MIKPEDAKNIAIEKFKSGLNCSQSVVATFASELGFDEDLLVSLAQPFGAGTCRMRETCGTVSGMMMCLGMKMGSPDADKAAKDAVYKVGQELAQEFKKENGSIICRQLLGLEKNEDTGSVSQERSREYYKKRPCAELCGCAAEIFARWLEKGGNDGERD
ncbi:MAG: C-GCAxxG-C-C family protein [Treponemataceae bacterium]|nr:C-GCAxxG-C-C family protein [Treponemataceae bacterium]